MRLDRGGKFCVGRSECSGWQVRACAEPGLRLRGRFQIAWKAVPFEPQRSDPKRAVFLWQGKDLHGRQARRDRKEGTTGVEPSVVPGMSALGVRDDGDYFTRKRDDLERPDPQRHLVAGWPSGRRRPRRAAPAG